ncbi:MAG: ribosome small subunit-dependent GTPase A [Bacteriovoracales bacterium]|nr:ribosome small subunit-dependent GTPase A [Bacteriovoracales bacterium]
MICARVYKLKGREFICKRQDNGQMIEAFALGTLLKKMSIVVGDYVEIEEEKGTAKILRVKDRRNEIYRLSVREKKKKISVSNVDRLAIVFSVSGKAYKRGLLDRYLARAQQWLVPPIVIFNKMDQFSGLFDLEFEIQRLEYCKVACFQVSSKGLPFSPLGSAFGFRELQEELAHKTVFFTGQSGVGKSTLVSSLSGGKVVLKSAPTGKMGKGIHTTTWSEIVESDNLTLIDSPGIRSFSLDDIREEELISLFPPLLAMARRCQFSNCTHRISSVNCSFYSKESYSSPLEQKIIQSYLDSFHRLLEDVKKIPSWQK